MHLSAGTRLDHYEILQPSARVGSGRCIGPGTAAAPGTWPYVYSTRRAFSDLDLAEGLK
jgi:hypothetical protein